MALNLKLSQNAAAAQAAALVGSYTNGSILKIYDGSQPATPETALTSQNLLATVTLPAAAAMSQSNGVLTAAAISSVTIGASGTPAWFRWFKSDGSTVIADGTSGTSGCDLNLNASPFVAGATLQVTSFTLTIPSA